MKNSLDLSPHNHPPIHIFDTQHALIGSPSYNRQTSDTTLTNNPILFQCVVFGTFMIWFASITINLGPTFLSGALAASADSGPRSPSCPLVHGPYRHYVLNVLWIAINLICVLLTLFHLRKLHRDLTKVRMFCLCCLLYRFARSW